MEPYDSKLSPRKRFTWLGETFLVGAEGANRRLTDPEIHDQLHSGAAVKGETYAFHSPLGRAAGKIF